MDKRKKYFMIVDTETANDIDCPLFYDFGFRIVDKKNNVMIEKSFILKDIFYEEEKLMKTAYYNFKIQLYKKMIKYKEIETINILDLFFYIRNIMKNYNVKEVYAYNASFDLKALNNTLRYITKSQYRYFFPYGTEIYCIQHMACQVLYTQKTFLKTAFVNKWETAKGNVSVTAEIGYKYISNNIDFFESHTALEDVKIEQEILDRCFRQHKKMSKKINRNCWRIPQKDYKEIKMQMILQS